jgi:hypothetical protein
VTEGRTPKLDVHKFKDSYFTLTGEPRARVALKRLRTLWFNTGTLCNITCRNCGKSPSDVMCASSRMVVKRKGSARPVVLACTLVPYDEQFELGTTLKEALHLCASTILIARNSAFSAAAHAA